MKFSYDFIKQSFLDEGWILLSTEYQNIKTPLEVKCPESHEVQVTYDKWRNNHECPICKQNKFKIDSDAVKPKAKGVTRTLALDAAVNLTGYSIFDDKKLIYYNTFESSKSDTDLKIKQVKEWVVSIINLWNPDNIIIEDIQLQQTKNLDTNKYVDNIGIVTFKILAKLQGVLINTCLDLNIPYKTIFASSWKKHCGIKGRSKIEQKMSAKIFVKEKYDITVEQDEADAICLGSCAVETLQLNNDIVIW